MFKQFKQAPRGLDLIEASAQVYAGPMVTGVYMKLFEPPLGGTQMLLSSERATTPWAAESVEIPVNICAILANESASFSPSFNDFCVW